MYTDYCNDGCWTLCLRQSFGEWLYLEHVASECMPVLVQDTVRMYKY